MGNKKTQCPKCLGSKTPMTPKEDAGFEYKACSLCKGEGVVTPELEEDFILSLNEDLINDNDFDYGY